MSLSEFPERKWDAGASQRLSRHRAPTSTASTGPLTSVNVILSKFAASQVDALMLLSDLDE